jgi:hypothetical protein
MFTKLTLNDFISKSVAKHSNKYDYSRFVYKGWDVKGLIGCPVEGHGFFEQVPASHLKGYGCLKCRILDHTVLVIDGYKKCSNKKCINPRSKNGLAPINEFTVRSSTKSGFNYSCKECTRSTQHKLEYDRRYSKRTSNVRNERRKHRYSNDSQYKLGIILRSRLCKVVRYFQATKKVSSVKDLGCTVPELVLYLESLWLSGMSWNNYGKDNGNWSIDHIKPFAKFNLEDSQEQLMAVHFTNLQPLWHADNLKKNAKYSS